MGASYLDLLIATGLGVKTVPISGAIDLAAYTPDGRAASELTPEQLATYAIRPMADRYVNVVECQTGTRRGTRVVKVSDFEDSGVLSVPLADEGRGAQRGDEVVFQPAMAFEALYTLGVPNVALVTGIGPAPASSPPVSPAEASALRRYDAVIASTLQVGHALQQALAIEGAAVDIWVVRPKASAMNIDTMRNLLTTALERTR